MPLQTGTKIGPYGSSVFARCRGDGPGLSRARYALDRDVAIKVLPDSVAQRSASGWPASSAKRKLLAALNHPHIAAHLRLRAADGTRALVMELSGEDLTARGSHRGGPIPLAEALQIARQIADALEAAHERGIVHRDLKPANIKVTPTAR